MSVPKPSPDLFPKKQTANKPKRKRVRRHLTQKVAETATITHQKEK